MATEPLWRVPSPDHLYWTQLDGEYVVFHRPSGKTHFVNSASALLLAEVLCSPTGPSAAARELARKQSTKYDANLVAQVRSLLMRLEELGLVDCIQDNGSL